MPAVGWRRRQMKLGQCQHDNTRFA